MKKTYQEKLSELALRIKNEDLAKYLYSFSLGFLVSYDVSSLSEDDKETYKIIETVSEKKRTQIQEQKKQKDNNEEELGKIRFDISSYTQELTNLEQLELVLNLLKNLVQSEESEK